MRLDVGSAHEVRAAVEAIGRRPGYAGGGVVVQPMAPPGVARVVEVAARPGVRPAGGFRTRRASPPTCSATARSAPVPLTDTDAHDLVRAPRAAPLLSGHRGAIPVDTDALEDLLLRVGLLADEVCPSCSSWSSTR